MRAAIRGDRHRRAPGFGERQPRRREIGAFVVGKVVGARGRQRFARLALRVERHRLEVLQEQVGIVARRAVAPRGRRLHLRVEPVGERGERAQQQHRRPRDEPIEEFRACGPSVRVSSRHQRASRASACGGSRARRFAPVAPLRREDHVGELAHGAAAAFARRDVVRMRAHRSRRMRDRHREPADREQRDVGQVVADVRAFSAAEPQLAAQALPRRQLVVRVEHEVRNAQLLRAMRDRGRRAAGDPRDDDVGYSKLSVNEQHARVEELNEIVRLCEQFRKAEAASRLLKIPTGDGMALVFYKVRRNRRSVRSRSAARSGTMRACEFGWAFTVDRSVVWWT